MKAFEDLIQPQELPGGTKCGKMTEARKGSKYEGPNASPKSKLHEKGLELQCPTIERGH